MRREEELMYSCEHVDKRGVDANCEAAKEVSE